MSYHGLGLAERAARRPMVQPPAEPAAVELEAPSSGESRRASLGPLLPIAALVALGLLLFWNPGGES